MQATDIHLCPPEFAPIKVRLAHILGMWLPQPGTPGGAPALG
jgi:hypothetical protein